MDAEGVFRPSGFYWKRYYRESSPANASKAEVWLTYEKVVEGRKNLTFSTIVEKILNSADYADLAPGTQKITAHEKYLLAVSACRNKGIKPEHVRLYMDAW